MTSAKELFANERLGWMHNDDIRPYVFVRPENRILSPGSMHKQLDWFPHDVLYKNPLEMDEVKFADRILGLEMKAFGPSGMAMPRWVFYDCAIVPGFVAGFAHRTSTLPAAVRKALENSPLNPDETLVKPNPMSLKPNDPAHAEDDWTPLSLFIIIPTMAKDGEWVAHNLCSVNSLLAKEDQFYGIGFLSKAFGLWYANVRTCCGMTQWGSPAVRLHAHYGDFEVLTAYTPVHSYARTLTYRVKIDVALWSSFFTKQGSPQVQDRFMQDYKPSGFQVDPQSEENLISFQRRLERREGPYFLHGAETVVKGLTDPLTVFQRK
jgi:hypothetical protein